MPNSTLPQAGARVSGRASALPEVPGTAWRFTGAAAPAAAPTYYYCVRVAGAPPSAAQDATVATSLATAAAMLHSTLPVRNPDTFKMLGWCYTRAATAGVTATEAAAEDPVGAAAALHVEEEALLGYSQVCAGLVAFWVWSRVASGCGLEWLGVVSSGSCVWSREPSSRCRIWVCCRTRGWWTAAVRTIAPTRPCSSEGSGLSSGT